MTHGHKHFWDRKIIEKSIYSLRKEAQTLAHIPGSHHEITGKRLPDRKVEA